MVTHGRKAAAVGQVHGRARCRTVGDHQVLHVDEVHTGGAVGVVVAIDHRTADEHVLKNILHVQRLIGVRQVAVEHLDVFAVAVGHPDAVAAAVRVDVLERETIGEARNIDTETRTRRVNTVPGDVKVVYQRVVHIFKPQCVAGDGR